MTRPPVGSDDIATFSFLNWKAKTQIQADKKTPRVCFPILVYFKVAKACVVWGKLKDHCG